MPRNITAILLMALGILFNWVLKIILFIGLCFYVVFGFLSNDLVGGFITLGIGVVIYTVSYFLLSWIGTAIMGAGVAISKDLLE